MQGNVLLKGQKVILWNGLQYLDDELATLTTLWEELQLSAVEAAYPELDFLSFVTTAAGLYPIMSLKPLKPRNPQGSSQSAIPSADEMDQFLSLNDELAGQVDPFDVGLPNVWDSSDAGVPWRPALQATSPLQVTPPRGYRRSPLSSNSFNASTVRSPYEDPSPPFSSLPEEIDALVGFAYLTESFHVAPSTAGFGELNLGIIIRYQDRGKRYAQESIDLLLPHVLKTMKCHRLQVSLMSMPHKDRAMKLFTGLGFSFEGTRRRSFYSGMEQEWKDVTTLALLDSDFCLRRKLDLKAPRSLWDELFNRHERERQELLRWEERTMSDSSTTVIKRTASMETIRMPMYTDTDCEPSGSETEASRATTPESSRQHSPSPSPDREDHPQPMDEDPLRFTHLFQRAPTPRQGSESPPLPYQGERLSLSFRRSSSPYSVISSDQSWSDVEEQRSLGGFGRPDSPASSNHSWSDVDDGRSVTESVSDVPESDVESEMSDVSGEVIDIGRH